MTERDTAVSWRELAAARGFGQYVLLCLGILLHAADTLVTATLMPAAVLEIGGVAYINWTVALYQIGSIVTGAMAGVLTRRHGLRAVFIWGALIYAAGCLLAALAPNMASMLIGRITQGVGGGLMLALSYLAVPLLFPQRLWSKLYALSAAIWSIASLGGPLIGGVFADAGIWRGAFWTFGLPALGLAAAGRVLRSAEPPAGDAASGMSWAPVALLTAAVFAVAEAGALSDVRWSVPLGLSGLALLGTSAFADRHATHPLFPRQMLDVTSSVGQGMLMVFTLSAGTTAFWTYGPLVMKVGFGIDPLLPGLFMALESLFWSACTVWVARYSADTEPFFIRVGVCLTALGAAGLSLAMPRGSLWGIGLCLALQGAGFGLSWPFILRRAIVAAPAADRLIAGTATPAMQRIGYAVGAAATGIAANATGLAAGISAGAARAAGMWVFAAFVPILAIAVGAACAFSVDHGRAPRSLDGVET